MLARKTDTSSDDRNKKKMHGRLALIVLFKTYILAVKVWKVEGQGADGGARCMSSVRERKLGQTVWFRSSAPTIIIPFFFPPNRFPVVSPPQSTGTTLATDPEVDLVSPRSG